MKKLSSPVLFSILIALLSAFVIVAAPVITLNSVSPATICSTGNDTLYYSVTATGIPANTNVVIYQYTDSIFNPYTGPGDSIGFVPGNAIPVDTVNFGSCVKILGIFIDACGVAGTEPNNEYIILTSGSGIRVNNLGIDFSTQNNAGATNADINTGASPCAYKIPNPALITSLRVGSCNASNVIPANPTDSIPANAIILVFTSDSVNASYNINGLCNLGHPIYILQSACKRTIGAFTNASNCGATRYRTTTAIDKRQNCTNNFTYDLCNIFNKDGTYAIRQQGIDTASVTNNGIRRNTVDSCGGLDYSQLNFNADTILKYKISPNFCNTGYHYLKAITHPNGTQPISNTIKYKLVCNDVTAVSNTTNICSGDTAKINISSTDPNATLSWIVSGGTGISGATAGSGNTIKQKLTNISATIDSVSYSVLSSDNGCNASKSITVKVKPAVMPVISGNLKICNGNTVKLSVQSPFDSLRWNTNQTSNSIDVTQAGTYSVTAYKNGCSGTSSVNVSGTTVSISISGATFVCNGSSTDITAVGTFDSIRWNTNATSASIHVTQGGSYSVTGYSGGCSVTTSVQVTSGAVSFSITGNNQLCNESTDTLRISGQFDSIRWNTGATGNQLFVSTPGNYSATVYQNACSGSANTLVTTCQQVCNPRISGNKPFCIGDSITLNAGPEFQSYLWNTGAITQTIKVKTPGKYVVTVTDQNCTGKDSVIVTVNQLPQVSISGNTSICEDGQTTLTANADFDSLRWNTNETSASISVFQAQNYSVTVYKNGCSATSSVQVNLLDPPSPFSLGNDTTFCGNFSKVLFTGNQNTHWSTNVTAAQITVTQAGTYTATITNTCGSEEASITISKNELPLINIGNDTAFCDGELVLTVPGQFRSILWSTGSENTSITVSSEGTYAVKVTDENNCSNTDSITITSNCVNDLFIPNAFSPNGDGINDVFLVRGNPKNTTIEKFTIYNRWGNKVFESANTLPGDVASGWNGKYKGEPAQMEVYGYYVIAKFSNGEKKVLKGNVTLLR